MWVENGGVVGRGVLLDYKGWAEANGTYDPASCFKTTPIPVSTLEAIAAHQNVSFKTNDILLIRTGWTSAYSALAPDARQTLSDTYPPPAIGVESSEETVRWMWDKKFAAVAGDQPSFEAWPCQSLDFLLHEWLLAGWGCPIGEIFDLDALAENCREKGKWSFFFSSVPIHVSSLVGKARWLLLLTWCRFLAVLLVRLMVSLSCRRNILHSIRYARFHLGASIAIMRTSSSTLPMTGEGCSIVKIKIQDLGASKIHNSEKAKICVIGDGQNPDR